MGGFPFISMKNPGTLLEPPCSLVHDIRKWHAVQSSPGPWVYSDSESDGNITQAIVDRNCNTFLKAGRPRPRDYPHTCMPPDYRHTDITSKL